MADNGVQGPSSRITPNDMGDSAMRRREMMASTGAALLGLSAFPLGWAAAAENKKQRMLYFTRSAG
jgi:hypothetical protein